MPTIEFHHHFHILMKHTLQGIRCVHEEGANRGGKGPMDILGGGGVSRSFQPLIKNYP